MEILGLWIAINIMFWIVFFTSEFFASLGLSFFNPVVFYNNIKVNWFGAWLLAIVFNLMLPSAAVFYWIYKICTVGRK